MRALVWLQNDLRIHDNTALYHASCQADEGVIAVYCIAEDTWRQHNIAECKIDFIFRNLADLAESLAKHHIALLIRQVDSFQNIPKTLRTIVEDFQLDAIFFNKQYEVDERACQQQVMQLLMQINCKVWSYDDQTIIAPGKVLTQQGSAYNIFTPFKKSWLKALAEQGLSIFPKVKKAKQMLTNSDVIALQFKSFKTKQPLDWIAGEKAAENRLKNFIKNHLSTYHQERDYPIKQATSMLSPYLAIGVISARQCLAEVIKEGKAVSIEQLTEGPKDWVNELIWREFYKHILFHFPRVSMSQPFKLATKKIIWNNDKKQFIAWQKGKTGYPLIDAAMRQLQQTGWMHNRLRMVVAMFLTKNLFIDWRWGEKYFMHHLIDGDLASNNGGWQWAASTGTDAAPYFRIFNPIRQSKKFDPNGEFIKLFCPELTEFSVKEIHEPYQFNPSLAKKCGYPEPIVELNHYRPKVLKAFLHAK